MENPDTWNKATMVITDALTEAYEQKEAGLIGHSPARIIHDALEREGLLVPPSEAGTVGETTRIDRQISIGKWAVAAFGEAEATSLPQRGVRLLEEAAEAAQSTGVSLEQAKHLMEYVWGRPAGELYQELGGVGVTALALAHAAGLDAENCEVLEVNRVLLKPIEHFTKRNQEKNDAGLRAAPPAESERVSTEEEIKTAAYPVCGRRYEASDGEIFTPRLVNEKTDEILYTGSESVEGIQTATLKMWTDRLALIPSEPPKLSERVSMSTEKADFEKVERFATRDAKGGELILGVRDADYDRLLAAYNALLKPQGETPEGGGKEVQECKSDDGTSVGIIDSIMLLCRLLADRDISEGEGVDEALKDAGSDPAVRHFFGCLGNWERPQTEIDRLNADFVTNFLKTSNAASLPPSEPVSPKPTLFEEVEKHRKELIFENQELRQALAKALVDVVNAKAKPVSEPIIEEIAQYIESDSSCLMDIVVNETKHDYGVRLLKVMADEIRVRFGKAEQ